MSSNHWLRLRQIALVAKDIDAVVGDITSVLGVEVCFIDPGVKVFGLQNRLMPVGNQIIEVVAPIQEGTAGGRYLERRGGDGGYMVITQCDLQEPRRARLQQLGVRLVSDFDHGGLRNMQLHPKDTGGSFFEIDQVAQAGAEAADGPWPPAGDDWKAHKRTNVVDGIVAAEIQADDPAALAKRWAEIAELPVVKDAKSGHPSIALENASVRFVPITDGRPEGLGGIDVHVLDRAHVLREAKARGAYRSDDQVYLCGMRVNLV